MWSVLHPDIEIDNVKLSVPSDVDKAIDVVLKFHGVTQDSPRTDSFRGIPKQFRTVHILGHG